MENLKDKPGHQFKIEEALRLLDVDVTTGLSSTEIKHRQEKFGPNSVAARRGTTAWLKFLKQFNQPLIYILLAATAITAALGEWVDASVIFVVIFINAIIGYLQEAKAEKAIDALAKMVITEATARRGGEKLRIPSAQLVPGDVVLLNSGDRVPADLRLLHQRNLQIEEAAPTGESVPVAKQTEPLSAEAVLSDRTNLAFTGTLVTYGQGNGVVFATGNQTEMGRIAGLIDQAENLQTPLTRKITQFS